MSDNLQTPNGRGFYKEIIKEKHRIDKKTYPLAFAEGRSEPFFLALARWSEFLWKCEFFKSLGA